MTIKYSPLSATPQVPKRQPSVAVPENRDATPPEPITGVLNEKEVAVVKYFGHIVSGTERLELARKLLRDVKAAAMREYRKKPKTP